jgi:hypothetical protein
MERLSGDGCRTQALQKQAASIKKSKILIDETLLPMLEATSC